MPKRGEKGFTLIELLIVVAILGVLAAVVIPNVGRFVGKGDIEARKTEFQNVQTAVMAMMLDNNISVIPNPIILQTAASNAMDLFPDTTSVGGLADKLKDPAGVLYVATDKAGFLLYGHDRTADGIATVLANYVNMKTTKYYYTSEADGTVHQWPGTTGDEYVY